jgi:polysaccharide export outer membrane protein
MSKFIIFLFGLAICVMSSPPAAIAQQKQTAESASGSRQTAMAMGEAQADQVDKNRPTLEHERYPRYRVMRDDVMVISFALSPELNQTATIQPDGYITLQSVGSIYVQGLTVPQLVEAIKKSYSKILHDPIVDVNLTDFQKPFFLVLGSVNKPGQYDLRNDLTVSEGVAIAGGFTGDGKTQVLLFHRTSADWVEVKKLNLKDFLNGKNVNEDVHLQPGDMIFVPEKFITQFKRYVPYTTGLYFNPSSTIF